jgi:hypothetical protein
MTVAITAGTIAWASGEVKAQFVAKGIEPTLAGYIDSFINWFTGSTAFPTLDRNAGLILALHNVTRPLVEVAKALWGLPGYGTAGGGSGYAATIAQVVAWINATPPWMFDSNAKTYGRPDLRGPFATVLGDIINYYLADATTGFVTNAISSIQSGALVQGTLYDDDVNSRTYNTLVVLTPDQYARSIFAVMRKITKVMRYFAVGSVVYPADSYNYSALGTPNIGPVLDDTKGAGSSEIG